MGGCRLLPRSCVPPNRAYATAAEQEDEQVVRDFVDQVWNYQWRPEDWYTFLPPDLRDALDRYLDPTTYVRYRRASGRFVGLPGASRQGHGQSSVYGLGACVRKLREVSPHVSIRVQEALSRDGQVMAVLAMTGPDPRGRGQFQSTAAVLYRLTGPSGDRRIREDWALSDGFSVEL